MLSHFAADEAEKCENENGASNPLEMARKLCV